MSSPRAPHRRSVHRAILVLLTSLWTAALSTATPAQILGDGLDGGPCCTQANPVLPAFPKIKLDALELCWQDCNLDNALKCRMTLSTPIPVTGGGVVHCGRFYANLRLLDPNTNTLKWRGRTQMTYSRTWFETDGGAQRLQVWRFLIQSNLKPTAAAGGPPCPVPPCASTFGNVRVTGYVDYALDLSSGAWSHAWMMHHSCDAVDHAPGFPRQGAFHPDRTYTFVGPSASFAIGALQPVEAGGSPFEDMRHNLIPTPIANITLCDFEEPSSTVLNPLQFFCFCGTSGAPNQYVLSDLSVFGACGTTILTPGTPYLPGFLSMGIGAWTDPTKYPGNEILRWNTGGYDDFDSCTGVTRQEVFFGVSTIGGYTAFQVINGGLGAPLPPTFLDQGNSIKKSDGVSTIMNVLYASDRILNLNY